MTSQIRLDHIRQARRGWTTRLVEYLLEQLSCPQLFMDVDIIPDVWNHRSLARREHWEGTPVVEAFPRWV